MTISRDCRCTHGRSHGHPFSSGSYSDALTALSTGMSMTMCAWLTMEVSDKLLCDGGLVDALTTWWERP